MLKPAAVLWSVSAAPGVTVLLLPGEGCPRGDTQELANR
jgi:hypothetical protein